MPSSQITFPAEPRTNARERPPGTVIVVGGLDPSGGAGLLRDVATARSLGAPVVAIGTAWTEQADGIHRVEPRAPAAVREALARALGAGGAAVKIGMAVGPATAAALVGGLADFSGPVVVDPVLASSRGGTLWAGTPADLLPLLRRATLVTPNGPEAAALVGRTIADTEGAVVAGRALIEGAGLRAVLVKGGHLGDDPAEVTDLLVTAAGTLRFAHRRVGGPSPRGTGCALATAIAVELASEAPLERACDCAIRWLAGAIASAARTQGELHLP